MQGFRYLPSTAVLSGSTEPCATLLSCQDVTHPVWHTHTVYLPTRWSHVVVLALRRTVQGLTASKIPASTEGLALCPQQTGRLLRSVF